MTAFLKLCHEQGNNSRKHKSIDDADVGGIVWRIVQFAALTLSLLLITSAFQLSRKAFFWLIAVLCASGPAWAAVQIEQVSLLSLCALSAAIWGFKKDKPWVTAIAL